MKDMIICKICGEENFEEYTTINGNCYDCKNPEYRECKKCKEKYKYSSIIMRDICDICQKKIYVYEFLLLTIISYFIVI